MSWTLPLITLGALAFFGAMKIAYDKWDLWDVLDTISIVGMVVTISVGLIVNGAVPVRTECTTPYIDRIISNDIGVTYVYVSKHKTKFHTTLDVKIVRNPEKYKLWVKKSYSSFGIEIEEIPVIRLIEHKGGKDAVHKEG